MKRSIFFRLDLKNLEQLFNYFSNQGYNMIGPFEKDGAIMCGEIDSFQDLPRGYYEDLKPGKYRLKRNSDNSLFQFTLGPQSFKPFLLPKNNLLWSADIAEGDITINKPRSLKQKKVFWGIRSCDLHSILTLDQVFLKQDYSNPVYEQLRKDLFTVSVNCTQPSANCFCSYMNTGPKASIGKDIVLTELFHKGEHFFICEAKSTESKKICKELRFNEAIDLEIEIAEKAINKSEQSMKDGIDKTEARRILQEKADDENWVDVENRCLACANCTLVCPTCFCTTTEDITDLEGKHTERWQKWDSCFNGDYSYIHGGVIRKSIKSRYRQWITHKLSTWYDQFDMSGCMGCGRCITWCPVGIDIRKEIKALQNHENGKI